jgi:hypothetical protein
MVDASEFFPELYLKGDDFATREVTMTIRQVVVETLHGNKGPEEKIVMYFDETRAAALKKGKPQHEKRIIASKSLYVDFVAAMGKQTSTWETKRFTFYRAKQVGSGTKLVIRARPATPETQPQPANNEPSQS